MSKKSNTAADEVREYVSYWHDKKEDVPCYKFFDTFDEAYNHSLSMVRDGVRGCGTSSTRGYIISKVLEYASGNIIHDIRKYGHSRFTEAQHVMYVMRHLLPGIFELSESDRQLCVDSIRDIVSNEIGMSKSGK